LAWRVPFDITEASFAVLINHFDDAVHRDLVLATVFEHAMGQEDIFANQTDSFIVGRRLNPKRGSCVKSAEATILLATLIPEAKANIGAHPSFDTTARAAIASAAVRTRAGAGGQLVRTDPLRAGRLTAGECQQPMRPRATTNGTGERAARGGAQLT
jgi:hypothetical protein